MNMENYVKKIYNNNSLEKYNELFKIVENEIENKEIKEEIILVCFIVDLLHDACNKLCEGDKIKIGITIVNDGGYFLECGSASPLKDLDKKSSEVLKDFYQKCNLTQDQKEKIKHMGCFIELHYNMSTDYLEKIKSKLMSKTAYSIYLSTILNLKINLNDIGEIKGKI